MFVLLFLLVSVSSHYEHTTQYTPTRPEKKMTTTSEPFSAWGMRDHWQVGSAPCWNEIALSDPFHRDDPILCPWEPHQEEKGLGRSSDVD